MIRSWSNHVKKDSVGKIVQDLIAAEYPFIMLEKSKPDHTDGYVFIRARDEEQVIAESEVKSDPKEFVEQLEFTIRLIKEDAESLKRTIVRNIDSGMYESNISDLERLTMLQGQIKVLTTQLGTFKMWSRME